MDLLNNIVAIIREERFTPASENTPHLDRLFSELPVMGYVAEARCGLAEYVAVRVKEGAQENEMRMVWRVTGGRGSSDYSGLEFTDHFLRDFCKPSDLAGFTKDEAEAMLDGLRYELVKKGTPLPRHYQKITGTPDVWKIKTKTPPEGEAIVAPCDGYLLIEDGAKEAHFFGLIEFYGLFGAIVPKPLDNVARVVRRKTDLSTTRTAISVKAGRVIKSEVAREYAYPYVVLDREVEMPINRNRTLLPAGTVIVKCPSDRSGYRILAPHMLQRLYVCVPEPREVPQAVSAVRSGSNVIEFKHPKPA